MTDIEANVAKKRNIYSPTYLNWKARVRIFEAAARNGRLLTGKDCEKPEVGVVLCVVNTANMQPIRITGWPSFKPRSTNKGPSFTQA